MKAITARKAAPHITPLMDAMWHRGIVTAEDCIFDSFEKFAADIASNNEVRIRSGVGMLQGRFFCIEPGTYDSAAISNGTQGEKRIDLIVARWTVNASSETEDVEIKVIRGTPTADTPVAPDYTEGDLDNGELVADLPLYEVNINGISVESLSAQFETGWLLRNGTLPVSKGGTGKTSHTSNAVLVGNGASAVKNVATANGALYATAANGAPKFGALPIAQGGTGKTSAAAALAALGVDFKTSQDSKGSIVIGKLGIEWGYTDSLSIAANGDVQKQIAFTLPFKYAPAISPTLSERTNFPNLFFCNGYNATKTGFTINFKSTYSSSTTIKGRWIAIGEVTM